MKLIQVIKFLNNSLNITYSQHSKNGIKRVQSRKSSWVTNEQCKKS